MFQGRIIRQGPPDELRRLVKGDLLAVVTPDVHQAESILQHFDWVNEVQLYGDRLHVFVDSATRRGEAEAALRAAGVRVYEIRPAHPHLQEAFISLISHEGAHG